MRRVTPLVILAAVAASLLASPSASGAIEVQRGIAGINIGMSQATVRERLGRPASTRRARNDFGPYTELRYPRLRIVFQGDTAVTAVVTTRRSERTRRGIGVGSTLADLRRKVAGIRCEVRSGEGICYVGSFLPGRRVTDFRVVRRTVVRVGVGIVID